MASSRRKQSQGRSNRPSLLGSLVLELVAIVGFLSLMSAANSNRGPAEDTTVVGQRTARYGTMIKGYLSDQFQRTGLVAR